MAEVSLAPGSVSEVGVLDDTLVYVDNELVVLVDLDQLDGILLPQDSTSVSVD